MAIPLQTQPRYADDPAYTQDVRHLALPMRRNSGPDSARRKSCSLLDGKMFDREIEKFDTLTVLPRKKSTTSAYKLKCRDAKYKESQRLDDSTSSDEANYMQRGQSLDRNIYKQQKKMLCFQRDKDCHDQRIDRASNRKAFSKENLLAKSPRSMNEFISDCYDEDCFSMEMQRLSRTKDRSKQLSSMISLEDRKYSSLVRNEAHSFEQLDQHKTKELSKFQIGKRLLKGEIGIKSFNYYLLKESLRSTKKPTAKFRSSSAHQVISKSDENIYEELMFNARKAPKTSNNPRSKAYTNYPDCELCLAECTDKNCDICKANEERKQLLNRPTLQPQPAPKAGVKAPLVEQRNQINMEKMRTSDSHDNLTNAVQSTAPNVLQYQSYNPKNPGIYKIETTPVAFTSEYNPIDGIYKASQKYAAAQKNVVAHKISSSSSDSLHHQKYSKSPKASSSLEYPNDASYREQPTTQIYKTDSKASILSEMSIKSENSTNRYYKQAEMSDSSMGDSMFSYSAQRRYYGSAESCQLADCQPCDAEKCSFSDNCRYECRNCDCSSSYFSSDFDDGNLSRKGSARISNNSQLSSYDNDIAAIDTKQSRYAEDFMKHLSNVKKTCNFQTTGNSVQVPLSAASQMHAVGVMNATNKMKALQTAPNTGAPKSVNIYEEHPKKPLNHASKLSSNSGSNPKSSSDVSGTKLTGAIPKSSKSNETACGCMEIGVNGHQKEDELVERECSHGDKQDLKQTVCVTLTYYYSILYLLMIYDN